VVIPGYQVFIQPDDAMVDKIMNATRPRRYFLQLTALAGVSLISPKAFGAGEATDEPVRSPASAESINTFDDVWQTVRDRFYDPHLHGLDWSAVRERYRAEAAQANSDEHLAHVINTMLSQLQASHTRYYTPDEPEYYQLADIFAGTLRRRGLDRAFPGGRISYPGIGVLTRTDVSGAHHSKQYGHSGIRSANRLYWRCAAAPRLCGYRFRQSMSNLAKCFSKA
jgi:carboxyl-terminal processing protease